MREQNILLAMEYEKFYLSCAKICNAEHDRKYSI